MKEKKCPNCLCVVEVNARVCPYCKISLRANPLQLLSAPDFKPPEVLHQDVKPLHNTKVTTQLPQLPKKEESEVNIGDFLEVAQQTEIKIDEPFVPRILNPAELPQNNFVDDYEEQNEEIEEKKPAVDEFDFNGELMQEIKAYFEMPSPNVKEYEQSHLDIIENLSIDDIIHGSVEADKKEKKQESFGLMFGAVENTEQINELPSYQEVVKPVEKVYKKSVEKKDYNSYLYDTLDTNLDALGFIDEGTDFKDLKKKLAEPEPTLKTISSNIVENIPFKILKNIPHHQTDIQPEQIEEIKIPEIFAREYQENDNSEALEAIDFLQIRGKLVAEELNKQDPYYYPPFEIDNIEIAEVKDYFKEEKIEEIVSASEINVNPDFLKELNDFAGVGETPEVTEINEELEEITEIESVKGKPKFQGKNVLRVSDEKIEEVKGKMSPTKIIRDAISELESLKTEFGEYQEEDGFEINNADEEFVAPEINTDLSGWFQEAEKTGTEEKEEITEETESSFFNLSDLTLEPLSDTSKVIEEQEEAKEENTENTPFQFIPLNSIVETFSEDIKDPDFINENDESNEIKNTESEEIIETPDFLKGLGIFEENIDLSESIKEVIEENDLSKQENNLDLNIIVDTTEENEILDFQIPESILNINETVEVKNVLEQENVDFSIEIPQNIIAEISTVSINDIENEIINIEDKDVNDIEVEEKNELSDEDNDEIEEIKVPDFLVEISKNIEVPKIDEEEIIIQKEELPENINNAVLGRLKNIVPEPEQDFEIPANIIESVKESVIPPPPPPPPFVDPAHKVVENKTPPPPPQIRNPITTTLNTTLGARGTTNELAMNHYVFARDLCLKKEYTQALDELEKAVKIDPAFEIAHILLSRTYLKLKNVY